MRMTDKVFSRPMFGLFLGLVVSAIAFFCSGFASFAGDIEDGVKLINDTTGYKIVIVDDADLLTDIEESAILDVMKPCTKYGHIALFTTNVNGTTPQYYAEGECHKRFGKMASQSCFLIDMDNRQIFVYSDGENYKSLTDQKGTIITDNIYRDASNGDYYLCAYNAFEQMYKVLDGRRIAEPMRYISVALISVLVAMLICFIIINSYSKLKSPSVADILGPVAKVCEAGPSSVVLTGESKKYSPRSSSSGGGGGGGGHHSGGGGGGGHSGGGGGHGF